MQVRPHITLLFVLSVFTILLLVSFAFYIILPGEDESIPVFGGIKISFIKPADIFKEKEQYADISEIIAQNELIIDSTAIEENIPEPVVVGFDTVKANADSLKQSIRKIEFPNKDRSILFPVFKAMDSARINNKVVRVMHFGDSQIEGDRITSFLRNRLHKKFGGTGVGLVPARQLYDFKYSVFHEASENWNRYTVYGKRDTLIKHKRYGILAGFNSFTPQPVDSSRNDTTMKNAWISFESSPYSYANTKKFEQCRLFYGHNTLPFNANLYLGDTLVDQGTYKPSSQLKQIQWLFNEPANNIKIEFEAVQSPEIYGVALDGKSGVAVDNIAMRGSAGLVFTKMDPVLFKQLIESLDVKLLILQFGGNILPNIRKDYSYYERWFYSQLNYIKTHAPDVEIVVIGVADMSMKKGSRYVSYPNIELVRDAMKKASFRAGAAYWDMFEAMGGKNSMPSWVFANPSLAGKDFVHFTPRGAKIIANMFYNALMNEYIYYQRKQPKQMAN